MLATDILKGVIVEIVRIIWDMTVWRNPILDRIHDEWFNYWVEYKVQLTMKDVDRQVEELVKPAEVDEPVFSEEDGTMGLRAPWLDEVRD